MQDKHQILEGPYKSTTNKRTAILKEKFNTVKEMCTTDGPKCSSKVIIRENKANVDTLPIAKHSGYSTVEQRIGTKENIDASQAGKKIIPDQEYILLPLLTFDPSLSKSSKDSPDAGFKPSGEEEKMDYLNTKK
ncbi:hypothetical protein Tco_0656581 [Tanacetum coccineum]|uniref:Uncharacterized protein n=1 Tax=Tanacetum coccineum TaxID=301880 RepID=A0ABQ4XAF2_9ASTR